MDNTVCDHRKNMSRPVHCLDISVVIGYENTSTYDRLIIKKGVNVYNDNYKNM